MRLTGLERHRVLAFLGCLIAILQTGTLMGDQPRIWKTAKGGYAVEAILVDADENQVRLKRVDNDKVVSVPLKLLSKEDREYLEARDQSVEPPRMNATEQVRETVEKSALVTLSKDEIRTRNIDALQNPSGLAPETECKVVPDENGYWHLAPYLQMKELSSNGWDLIGLFPPVFESTGKADPERLTCLVTGARNTRDDRLATINAAFNYAFSSMLSRQLNEMAGERIEIVGEVPDEYIVNLFGKTEKGGTIHFQVLVRFESEYTFVFEAVGTSKEAAEKVMKVVETMKPYSPSAVPMIDKSVPPEIVADFSKYVDTLVNLIRKNEMEAAFELLFSKEGVTQMKTVAPIYEQIWSTFQKEAQSKMLPSLLGLNIKEAIYDKTEQQIVFEPESDQAMRFDKIPTGWRIYLGN